MSGDSVGTRAENDPQSNCSTRSMRIADVQEDEVPAWARASFCGDHSASAEELEGATLWSRRRREATCTRSPQRAVFPCFSPYGLCWPQTNAATTPQAVTL